MGLQNWPPSSPPKRTPSWRRQRINMLVPFGLLLLYHHLGAGPKPIGWASHRATFQAPCHTNQERRNARCLAEMPPHTLSAIFASSTSQKLFIIQAIVIHPLILSSIPRNGIAKKSNIAPKKIRFVFHSWFFLDFFKQKNSMCVLYVQSGPMP